MARKQTAHPIPRIGPPPTCIRDALPDELRPAYDMAGDELSLVQEIRLVRAWAIAAAGDVDLLLRILALLDRLVHTEQALVGSTPALERELVAAADAVLRGL